MRAEDRRTIGEALKTVEFGWPIGLPLCRPMGAGLHELQCDLSGNRTARLFFYVDRLQRLVVLHGFVKKTRQTPAADLTLARTNKRNHERSL
jgi:phage-related protein